MNDGAAPAAGPDGKEVLGKGSNGKEIADFKQAAPVSSRLEFFAQGDFSAADRETSADAAGFGGWSEAGTVGLEYAVSDRLTTGLAVGYVHNYTRIADGSSLDINGAVASAYASWFQDNFHLDGLYSFSCLENDLRWNPGNGTATAHPSTCGNTIALNTGYNITRPGVVTGPIGSLNYTHGEIDGFTDSNGVAVQSQRFDSLVSQLGWQASFPLPVQKGRLTRLTPQLRAAWAHQYLNGSKSVSAILGGFTATGNTPVPERDYASLGAGVLAEFGEKFSVMLDYQAEVGSLQVSQFISLRGGIKF
jgi:outer membrane lipase/esterase